MILHLVIGPTDHGVVRFARRVGELANGVVLTLGRADQADAARLAGPVRSATAVHLQYTDALYAQHTTDAATAFVHLRHRIAAIGSTSRSTSGRSNPVPVSVTMHDLPDPDDEPGRYRRRALSYARVAEAVDAVVLSSDHELARLRHLLPSARPGSPGPGTEPRLQVIPLPIEAPRIVAKPDRPTPRPEVAVFGFIFPGKGHEDVISAMPGLPPEVLFTALGRPADGHESMRAALAATADRSNRRMKITGFVADGRLDETLQRIAVPVVPARRISASGSINSWIAAGRRPLVADGPYPREFAQRYPGAIQLYRPGQLPALIRTVLADPGTSWLAATPPPELTAPAVAGAYRAFITDITGAAGIQGIAGVSEVRA